MYVYRPFVRSLFRSLFRRSFFMYVCSSLFLYVVPSLVIYVVIAVVVLFLYIVIYVCFSLYFISTCVISVFLPFVRYIFSDFYMSICRYFFSVVLY